MARPSVLLLAVVAAGAVVLAHPQGGTFHQTSNLVSVYATVTGRDGRYVRGLGAADFEIFDNDVPREITVFSNDVQPITVALIVDESGSMLARLARVGQAASAFVAALEPGDRASFATLTHEGVPLTPDHARLTAGIRAAADWPWWDAGSPLWGALDRAMTSLAREPGRRVLVVITDGNDTASIYTRRPQLNHAVRPAVFPNATRADIERRTAREGFVLYAVGFAESPFDPGLQAIARQSGGGYSLIDANASLARAFTDVVEDLHRQYLLGFEPSATDGTIHTISVRSRVDSVTVRARESYLADE